MQERIAQLAPGVGLCVGIAICAYALGAQFPFVGGPIFGILLGIAVASVRAPVPLLRPGMAFSSKFILQAAIVLFGATLNLAEVVNSGLRSFPVMVGTYIITVAAALVIGRLLGIRRILTVLVGIGTAICGASAIAAISGVLDADQADIAYSISTVFLFNIVAVLIFPPLGHLLHMTQHAFGLWSGTAINDTSSVVAAGFAYGHEAGSQAVIVKLTRTTLLIPTVLALAAHRVHRERRAQSPVPWHAVVPWFIVAFIGASALTTIGIPPTAWHRIITNAAVFLIVVALCAVGLSADFQKMRRTGGAPLLLGLVLWIIIAISSLTIANLLHLA